MILKNNITKQVVEYIKSNIQDGTWAVGEKMPSENELTKTLGVSRASVRMAIQQFIGIGVIESIHGKGTFVKSNDVEGLGKGSERIAPNDYMDIHQVLEFRLIVEPGSCYLAAQRATAKTIENLHHYLDEMKNAIKDSQNFVKYDIMFHEELCNASGNKLLEDSLKNVFQQNMEIHKQINEAFGYQDGIYYHTLILKAIQERNSNKAKKLMQMHLQIAIDKL